MDELQEKVLKVLSSERGKHVKKAYEDLLYPKERCFDGFCAIIEKGSRML